METEIWEIRIVDEETNTMLKSQEYVPGRLPPLPKSGGYYQGYKLLRVDISEVCKTISVFV